MIKKGKFALKVLVNIIIAGVIYSIANTIISNLTAGGVILSTIVSLAILLFIVPYIFQIHKGNESEQFLSLIVGLPVGFALLTLLGSWGVKLPALPLEPLVLGSASIVYMLTSYFAADAITSRFIK